MISYFINVTVNAALLLCLFTGELINSTLRISYRFNLLHRSTNMDEFVDNDDMLTEDIVGEDKNTLNNNSCVLRKLNITA